MIFGTCLPAAMWKHLPWRSVKALFILSWNVSTFNWIYHSFVTSVEQLLGQKYTIFIMLYYSIALGWFLGHALHLTVHKAKCGRLSKIFILKNVTGSDEKEQYKAYGKTFRKMIIDCLQKDPSKRPTATELLKHPFFKKAKDRKYLTQTLVAIGPSMETRVHKVNKL